MGLKYDKKNRKCYKQSFTHRSKCLLHMYLAYLKYGFGRATTDTSISIRENKISRSTALSIVKKYDNIFPKKFIKDFCEYFDMNIERFNKTVNKFINKKIFFIQKNQIILRD